MGLVKNAHINWQASTPLNKQFDDAYFSLLDGIAESEYVFLKQNGLPEKWKNKDHFVIAETGFGTGLNFLVTSQQWLQTRENNAHLTYFSVEKFPLSPNDLSKALSLWPQFNTISSKIIQYYPDNIPGFHEIKFVNQGITLVLMIGDVLAMLSNMQNRVDCWYLDGFSPAKNPDMWSLDVCKIIANHSHEKTHFATFTSASLVRKNLQAVGFEVVKVPGFGKKREMLTGSFANKQTEITNAKPWFSIKELPKIDSQETVIIGAGLAGLTCAWLLAQENIKSTIFESGEHLASGASGNLAGIVMPRFSVDMDLESQFYLQAFYFSLTCLNQLQAEQSHFTWHQSGVLQLISDAKFKKIESLQLADDFFKLLDKKTASELSNIKVRSNAIIFPRAGFVNPFQLCTALASSAPNLITIKTQKNISRIKKHQGSWRLFDTDNNLVCETKNIILTNGFEAKKLIYTDSLKLIQNRGQVSQFPALEMTKNLKLPVCGDGYIIPQINGSGLQTIGATYDMINKSLEVNNQDHNLNVEALQNIVDQPLSYDSKLFSGRASFRTTSKDHLPIVGPMIDEKAYKLEYKDLHHGRTTKNYKPGSYLPGLFISTAHGSRGLVSCFLSAAYLVSLITNKPITLPENIAHILHPGRFLIRNLKKSPKKY